MKKIFYYLCIGLFLLLIPISVKAINIDEVDIDAYVDQNGNAHIKETWVNPKAEGSWTEFYKTYDNLGDMTISDFTVSYNKQPYTYVDSWDINESFSEKSFKNGIYYEDSKTELCFGISNYSSGTYVLTYTINNFIVKLDDADMIYFNFISEGNNINNFHLKLYADEEFSSDIPVWGYGRKDGTAYVYDGYIEMNSEGSINENQYIVLLAKFPKNTFNSTYSIDKDFNYYEELAKKGSTSSVYSNPIVKFLLGIFSFIISNIWFIIILIIGIFTAKNMKNKIGSNKYDFGKEGRKLSNDIPMIRDIPTKDLYEVYLYATAFNFNKSNTDLLGAILLKWLKEGKITINKVESKISKKEESAIVLNPSFASENEYETKLHKWMYEASIDGILESKEFEKWCKKNYDKILKWFDNVLDYETDKLLENFTLNKDDKSRIIVTDKFRSEAAKVKGVKLFLNEFSRMDEKEAIEVNMWEYYLMYAQIFGIADKVAKQFKKLYPEVIEAYEERYGYNFTDYMFIHSISTSGMSTAISSRDRANAYSSGGGGFSSGGGGGGSFGGGGSMGGR